MLGLAMNTRKEKLSNINIRSALSSLFDFEWINKNLYHSIDLEYVLKEATFDTNVFHTSAGIIYKTPKVISSIRYK